MTQHMPQPGPLRFGPLGPRTVHLGIDMQNLFAEDTPWHTPWMKRVLPVVVEIAERHPEQTIFTRFIPAHDANELPGSWRRYYRHWAELTLERIDKQLLELVPPLARLRAAGRSHRQAPLFAVQRTRLAQTVARARRREPGRQRRRNRCLRARGGDGRGRSRLSRRIGERCAV